MRKTFLFLLITFGLSYSMAALFYLLGGQYPSTGGIIMAMAYMFTLALSVYIVQKLIYKEEIVSNLLFSFRINIWFPLAWLVAPVLVFLTLGISLTFSDISFSPGAEGFISKFRLMLSD